VRREIPKQSQGVAANFNQKSRDELVRFTQNSAQTTVTPADAIVEKQKADNALHLQAGQHGGFRLTAPDTRIDGAAGAVVTRRCVIAANAMFDGVQFASVDGSDNVTQSLVDIASVTVVFRGCRFTRRANDSGPWITIAAGGRVHFIGCVFDGVVAVAAVIDNLGIAGDVGVFGANLTGQALGVVTSIFVTT